LAMYLRAVRQTSVNPRLHLTLVGHSYGSLVAGLALHDGASAVVDDYVAYGSAGFHALNEAELGMAQGRVFVMLAPDDPIRYPAQLGLFGGDPAAGGFTRLSTAAATTPDGVCRDGACGHAGYPRSFSHDGRDMLFTTGYNTAVVAAGLAELAVRL
jgi:pimeloyl-ACP methyl ester carboxylesterase